MLRERLEELDVDTTMEGVDDEDAGAGFLVGGEGLGVGDSAMGALAFAAMVSGVGTVVFVIAAGREGVVVVTVGVIINFHQLSIEHLWICGL